MKKPDKPCYACGSNTWWLTPDGRWLCGKCHPNPNLSTGSNSEEEKLPEMVVVSDQPGESHLVPVSSGQKDYSPEVLALLDRVIKGNDKLFQALLVIQDIEEGEEKECQLDRWSQALDKLILFCQELKTKGYEECLYIENGKRTKSCLSNPDGFWCQVCPSSRKYAEEELMALPGPNSPRVKQPEFVPGQTEFLGKLGGKDEN